MIRIIILIGAYLLPSCSAYRYTSSSSSKEITDEIKRLEYEAISAEFKLDTGKIAQVLHDDFIAIYPDKLQNKRQELDGIYKNISARIKNGEVMDSLYLDNFQVKVYANTAIATFHTVTKGRRKDVPYADQRWRWYDVWVKQKGKWKLVSAQGTPIKK